MSKRFQTAFNLGAIIIFSFIFFGLNIVSAQTDQYCCLQKEDGQIKSCALQPAGGCRTTPDRRCVEFRDTRSGARCEIYSVRVEERVPCIDTELCAIHVQRSVVQCDTYSPTECAQRNFCFINNGQCRSRYDTNVCRQITEKQLCGGTTGSQVCVWDESKGRGECVTPLESSISKEYVKPEGYDSFLPPCAFDGSCNDVNDLLQVLVNSSKVLFGLMGAVALVFFVYGGFLIVASAGNTETVQKGKDVLKAAIIGIIIAFSAYLLISFLLTALGVGSEFRIIK